jgi:hypothetical protein
VFTKEGLVIETSDKLMNYEEAAAYLGLKPATIRRLTYTK